jgi:hypothetical protein
MIPPPIGVELEAYAAFAPRWVGAQKQRQLLEAEGILFDAKDRMDLKKYGWSGKDEEDIPQQPSLF